MKVHVLLAVFAGGLLWPTSPPSSSCSCGTDAHEVRERLRVTWAHAFAGEPLSDGDLQAFADADDILKCLSK